MRDWETERETGRAPAHSIRRALPFAEGEP